MIGSHVFDFFVPLARWLSSTLTNNAPQYTLLYLSWVKQVSDSLADRPFVRSGECAPLPEFSVQDGAYTQSALKRIRILFVIGHLDNSSQELGAISITRVYFKNKLFKLGQAYLDRPIY